MDTIAKDIVIAFLANLNDEHFEAAQQLLAKDMVFEGVLGTRSGSEEYMADMKKMRLKYSILKVMSNRDDIAVFYDIDMGKQTIFSAGWYEVRNGLIQRFKVVFDPRPLLEHNGN